MDPPGGVVDLLYRLLPAAASPVAGQLDYRVPNFSVLADWDSMHDSPPHVSSSDPPKT